MCPGSMLSRSLELYVISLSDMEDAKTRTKEIRYAAAADTSRI